MSGTEYPKIWSPYVRHTTGPNRNKFDESTWSRPEYQELSNCSWWWSEKDDFRDMYTDLASADQHVHDLILTSGPAKAAGTQE